MASQHTVRPGDHIARIALEHGFGDPRLIWEDGANADLRSRRPNPNVLFPGDVVAIPDRTEKQVPVSTARLHRFRAGASPLWLRIVVQGYDGEPLAEVECRLTVDGEVHELTADGDGLIETEIPRSAEEGALEVPSLGVSVPLRIGHLHPVDELSGYRGRLNNLGYFAGDGDDPEDPRILSAVEEFQCDHGLVVDGVFGPNTRAKLLEVHGC